MSAAHILSQFEVLLVTELFSPLVLRSGARLRNRVAKAAMEEGMAGSAQLPDQRLISLYRRWGAGGAYFLELATELATTSPLPLMLTGGITRRETAETVLASGVALVGMGTAIAVTPDLPNRWREGLEATERLAKVTWSDRTLASAASMALVRHQMRRITRGRHPTGRTHPVYALARDQLAQRRALRRYRGWLEAQAASQRGE